MDTALRDFHVAGIGTTIAFDRAVVRHPDFHEGRVTTAWLERKFMPAYESPSSAEVPA
jgi:biotin carboxylase